MQSEQEALSEVHSRNTVNHRQFFAKHIEACLAATRFLVTLCERQCIAHASFAICASKLQFIVPVHRMTL